MFLQMAINGGVRLFEEAHGYRVFFVEGTAEAHEVSYAPFDHVGVKEHWVVFDWVRWIAL